ncbi:MAG: type VI secretion system contractile sheath small subunit [Myxococcales bacterium]|nr:type VI secretion system contractile sheath small subunit [Myxococcales bacterium]
MAREGSIAPEERINIIYKSVKEGEVHGELPLNVLVLGDFKGAPDEAHIEDRELMHIKSKDDFKRELAAQRVHLDLRVPDRLSGEEGAEMTVSLDFGAIGDFGPEGILRQVPALCELKRMRDALSGLKSPLENQPSFRRLLNDLVGDLSAAHAARRDQEND